jgi:hypothetical protein
MWSRNSLPCLWYRSKQVYKSRSHSLCFMCTCGHFLNPSCAKLVIA